MRILAIIPMYENGKAHGKPLAYEVHDVTDPYITQFPVIIESDGTRRQSIAVEVTFKTEARAQDWITTQMEGEDEE